MDNERLETFRQDEASCNSKDWTCPDCGETTELVWRPYQRATYDEPATPGHWTPTECDCGTETN